MTWQKAGFVWVLKNNNWMNFFSSKHISVFVAKKVEVEECMLEYTFLETFTDYFFRWEKLIARIFLIGKKMIINFSSQDFSAECFFTRIYEKNKRYSSMFLNIVQKKMAVHVLVSKWSVKCLNLRTSRNVWFCRDWKGFFRVLLW